ncbi:hypothetical protein QTN25_009307 [Entamoeba marina]
MSHKKQTPNMQADYPDYKTYDEEEKITEKICDKDFFTAYPIDVATSGKKEVKESSSETKTKMDIEKS